LIVTRRHDCACIGRSGAGHLSNIAVFTSALAGDVTVSGVEFDVTVNPDLGRGPLSDFIFWPLVVDVTADGAETDEVVVSV
jgi:hypothetical protein